MDILLVLIVGIMNILCFFIGAKIGQKVSKGEPIETPNPIKVYREERDSVEQRKELEKYKIINENIDSYNGTSIGQKDIPI
jgi:hypothetical protein